MYISRVDITNFRCFGSTGVDFHPGVNIVIGENNSGKTALFAALGKVFGAGTRRRPEVHDFFQGVADLTRAPAIEVSVTLRSSSKDTVDDLALVSTWLTKVGSDWEARLTYRCFLPDKDARAFEEAVRNDPSREAFFEAVASFLPKYVTRVYGGNPADRLQVEGDSIARFQFQFLDALRDVQADMFSGRDPLLREMLIQVLDSKADELERKRAAQQFATMSKDISGQVKGRLDVDSLFKLVGETGAGDGGSLALEGRVGESELLAALRLVVERAGYKLPVINNGLGYNNLVYISLLLAKMDRESDTEANGENAVLFPMLLVEEPEAHLHPALQYKLLKYLKKRVAETARSRQVFITTHSTHITAACGLDDIVCLSATAGGGESPRVSYPGRVFGADKVGMESKKYVERFLDATKSSMLFSKAVILVEGLAEQLVIPRLADRMGKPLEDAHVALVSVDGSTFKHFLPLFGAGPAAMRQHALSRSVACLVDADPSKKSNDPNSNWKGCWPLECEAGAAGFTYKKSCGVVANLREQAKGCGNVLVATGTMTFEYDLALANPLCVGIITDACAWCDDLRDYCEGKQGKYELLEGRMGDDLKSALSAIGDPKVKEAHAFASFYLASIGKEKGAHALDLAASLRDDFAKEAPGIRLAIPAHISSAIEFAHSGAGLTA